ncbi:MAG: pentapeptide repeat-containing protein [Phormidium tanganyikae FI6-MK23]|jgi:uncharacterized protein YjbI with pentapeptide repeats|nr:pentapeptide repeat-containing protein [Phormidium tanganyikae FI6-MK23]
MKGLHSYPQAPNNNQESDVAKKSLSARAVLIMLIGALYFLAGFLTSFFGALTAFGLIVGPDKVRLSYSLLTIVVFVWLTTAIYQKSSKNLLITLFTFVIAIAVQQWSIKTYSQTFSNVFWTTLLFDTLIPLTVSIISFFAIRLANAVIDLLWCRSTGTIIKNIGVFLLTCAALLGAYSCVSMRLQIGGPKLAETLTSNSRMIMVACGVLFSYAVALSAWLSNRVRNAPWQPSGLLRSLALELTCWKSASFYDLDLSGINFRNANLANTDLRARKLYRTCFQGVTGLEKAKVDSRYLDLELPIVQQLLTRIYSKDKNFSRLNLRGAYLRDADLRHCDFTNTELTGADLSQADLQGAILVQAQVMGVDFTGANLTGICNKDWSINSETCFTDVQCDYIYRNIDDKGEPIDRYPVDRDFDSREFESLYQEVGNVVELVFKEGVNWRAFAFSLQKLQIEDDGLGLELKGIEKRGDLWVVKVTHDEGVSKAQVEHHLNAAYEELKRLLAMKEQQINNLLGIAADQAESLKDLAKRSLGNNFFISGSTITNLAGSGQIEYREAADRVRSLVTNRADPRSISQRLISQLTDQNVATTTAAQQELIQQVLISEAEQDPAFMQFLLQQGQEIIDSLPSGGIAIAVQAAISTLVNSKRTE